jgi:hypothetical protein
MRIPAPEQWKPIGQVLGTWGIWIIVYLIITMCIGLTVIAFCDIRTIKVIRKFLNN